MCGLKMVIDKIPVFVVVGCLEVVVVWTSEAVDKCLSGTKRTI